MFLKITYAIFFSSNIRVIKSRRMRWPRFVACVGERRGSGRVLVGRLDVRRPLGRPNHRWKDNIKMDF
jgi:hypothetical protein